MTITTQLDLFSHCQRWRNGRASYRPAGEVFDHSRASVALIDEASAKDFIVRNHYSRSYPAARLRVGLLVKQPFQAERLAGVAVMSVPMNNSAISAWFPDLEARQGVELGRFCLEDSLEANAETWFQARALRLVRQHLPEVRAVLSYCDPMARTTACGEVTFAGHVGTIYKAGSAKQLGRSTRRTLKLLPDGRVASERALSKIRNDESGAGYALAQLIAAGAPNRLPFESGADYLRRVDAQGLFRPLRHPGNVVFGWRLKPWH